MRQDIVLKQPVITEKSMLAAQQGKFTFQVDGKATKSQVKQAVEDQFKVNVVSISTITTKGKVKRFGKKRTQVKTSDTKKAIVVLKKGQKIDLFDIKEDK
jgi:large subunit ribosomal protein L23